MDARYIDGFTTPMKTCSQSAAQEGGVWYSFEIRSSERWLTTVVGQHATQREPTTSSVYRLGSENAN